MIRALSADSTFHEPRSALASAGGDRRSILLLASHPASLINFRGPLMLELVDLGWHVTAAAPAAGPEIVRGLAAMGVAYRDLPLARTGLDPRRDLASFRAVLRLLRELRPEVLLGYTVKPIVYGCLAARLAGVPMVAAMIEGLGFAFGEGRGVKRRLVRAIVGALYRLALSGADRVFFLNPDDRELFAHLGFVRATGQAVLLDGIGVDLAQFRPAPAATQPRFLMIARLIAAKGVRDYVAAGRLLRQRFPQAQLRLVGPLDDTPDAIRAAELEAWVRAGEIDYLGWLDDVRPALADSLAHVLPSYYREGVPRSSLEAMACGRAIITTDAPGCRETVRDGINGLLVPPRDPAALASAMARLVEDPELVARMGAASRRLAEARFDVHAVNRVILRELGAGRDALALAAGQA